MDQKAFLDRVVPRGIRTIAHSTGKLSPKGRPYWNHDPFEVTDEGVHHADRIANRNLNVYFALASFKDREGRFFKRQQDNVDKLKALFLDIDFKQYDGTLATTIAALCDFRAKSGMPAPSILVNSGGGLHVYWVFPEAIPVSKWQDLANGLAGLAKAHGLKADLGVTKDSARVLRMPGTRNQKYEDRPLCEVIGEGQDVDMAALAFLQNVVAMEVRTRRSAVAGTLAVDPSVAAMFGGAASTDLEAGLEVKHASKIVQACPLMADMMKRHGEGDHRNLWNNMLLLMAYAEGGREHAHALGNGHKDYDADDTNAQFEAKLALKTRPNMGPTKCITFSDNSEICTGCPHWGKITSPIELGVEREKDNVVSIDRRPYWVKDGRTWCWAENANHERVTACLLTSEMHDPKLLPDGDGGYILEIVITDPGKPGKHVVRMETAKFPVKDYIVSNFARVACFFAHPKILEQVLRAWVEQLREAMQSNDAKQPGWGWSPDGFIVAGTLYGKDGSVSVVSAPNEAIASNYTAVGRPEPWRKLASALIADPRGELQLILASAFAAPLVGMTGVGVTSTAIALRSNESAAGKTTVLHASRAVWGKPNDLAQARDTPLSVEGRVATLTDMPWYWDEVLTKSDKDFNDILFQILNGKSRGRSHTDGKVKHIYDIQGMLVTASNRSIVELMFRQNQGTDAAAMRIVDVELPLRLNRSTDDIFNLMADAIQDNYGHAGVAYAGYLAAHRDWIKKQLIPQVRQHLINLLQPTQAERYWIATFVSLLSGAMLAKHAGIADFDIPRLKETMARVLLSNRVSNADLMDPIELVKQVYRSFRANTYITEYFGVTKPGKSKKAGVILVRPLPGRNTYIRAGLKDNELAISYDCVSKFAEISSQQAAGLHARVKGISQLDPVRGLIRTRLDKGIQGVMGDDREAVYVYKFADVVGQDGIDDLTSAEPHPDASPGSSSGSAPSGSPAP